MPQASIAFFFNDTATTEIYTLSLHDALPICCGPAGRGARWPRRERRGSARRGSGRGCASRPGDRKSTRLNSSHLVISYAVFCLKKKKQNPYEQLDTVLHLIIEAKHSGVRKST